MDEMKINIPFKIELADSFLTRLKGLMFRKEPIVDEGLWIKPCNAVHMFFMRFPIDIVLLNKHNKVVKIYENLTPWRLTKPIREAYSTLELPAGAVKILGIKNGCTINCLNLK